MVVCVKVSIQQSALNLRTNDPVQQNAPPPCPSTLLCFGKSLHKHKHYQSKVWTLVPMLLLLLFLKS